MSYENYSKVFQLSICIFFSAGSSGWYDGWCCDDGMPEHKLVYSPEQVHFPAET